MSKTYSVHFSTKDGNAGGAYTTDKNTVDEIVEEMKTTNNAEVFTIWEIVDREKVLVYDSKSKQMELF